MKITVKQLRKLVESTVKENDPADKNEWKTYCFRLIDLMEYSKIWDNNSTRWESDDVISPQWDKLWNEMPEGILYK